MQDKTLTSWIAQGRSMYTSSMPRPCDWTEEKTDDQVSCADGRKVCQTKLYLYTTTKLWFTKDLILEG